MYNFIFRSIFHRRDDYQTRVNKVVFGFSTAFILPGCIYGIWAILDGYAQVVHDEFYEQNHELLLDHERVASLVGGLAFIVVIAIAFGTGWVYSRWNRRRKTPLWLSLLWIYCCAASRVLMSSAVPNYNTGSAIAILFAVATPLLGGEKMWFHFIVL